MSKYVLSVSYNESLLITRRMMLERVGYRVASALGFKEAASSCGKDGYDLFVLGHSIPHADKEELIKLFRNGNRAPVLSLERNGERSLASTEYHVSAQDPQEFLMIVADILGQSRSAKAG